MATKPDSLTRTSRDNSGTSKTSMPNRSPPPITYSPCFADAESASRAMRSLASLAVCNLWASASGTDGACFWEKAPVEKSRKKQGRIHQRGLRPNQTHTQKKSEFIGRIYPTRVRL